MSEALSGMSMNWHITPTGIDFRCVLSVNMFVKSDFCRLMPVASMTPPSIIEIIWPELTHCRVRGLHEPRVAEPRTKSGKRDVSLARI